jgi:hypothetical protein
MSHPPIPEPTWWREDPERWELLEFDGRHTEDGLPIDTRWEDRRQVVEALVREPSRGDGDFARHLLLQKTRWHGHSWGFSYTLEIAALRVGEERRVDDVWMLWEAVFRSFDTVCGLPHQLLYAAGVARTVEYVQGSDHPGRDHVLEDLAELRETSDEDVTRVLAARRRHYAEALADVAGE